MRKCHAKRKRLIPAVLLACGTLLSAVEAQTTRDPLATLRAGHPRLLFLAAEQERIEDRARADALLARLIEQNQVNAAEMLGEPSVRYEIADGKRLLPQSRKCVRRVLALAMAYRLSGDERFADAAIKEMLVAAKFTDWNPSHFLDTAEMTTALAIGYDWLYDIIRPTNRQIIRTAIVELGLNEGQQVYESTDWWVDGDNNWNQVCNGGMILGALAIADEEPALATEIISAALESIPHGVKVYNPSGAYPEGPAYWQYGTSYTCLTIKALNTALGTDFDLRQTPGLNRTGWFRIHMIGPTGLYFNFADCSGRPRLASSMFLLSDVYDQPTYARWHRERLARQFPAGKSLEPTRLDRFFPLEIAWYDARGKRTTATELPLDALFKSKQDIVTMRSQWGDKDAIYVGFKGGDNQTNHGHLDIGSFVLDAEGVRWAMDLGTDDYNLPGFFGSKRWQYYRLINHSHNTLVINDQLQNPHAQGAVIAFHSTPQRASAVVDMTDAYKDQAESTLRGIELLDRRAIHVRDEITGARGAVQWGMVTSAKIQLAGNQATLEQDGRQLLAEILMPDDARFEIMSTKPPTTEEKQNEGTRILAAIVPVHADGRVEISVLLQPASKEKTIVTLRPQPLGEWPKS